MAPVVLPLATFLTKCVKNWLIPLDLFAIANLVTSLHATTGRKVIHV